VAVGHVDVGRREIATQLDVLREPSEHPHAPAAQRLPAVSKCRSDPISASKNLNASRFATTSYSSDTIPSTSPMSSRIFALNPLAGISAGGCVAPKSSVHSGVVTTSTSPCETFQPSTAFSSASSIDFGYSSSTAPSPCQGGCRRLSTENIESVSVMP
jgi:hypothetical protein